MREAIFLCLMILFTNHLAFSQSQGFYDSLNTANELLNERKINEAILILESCEKAHPNNIHVIRLHGKALYWSKDFEATNNYFRASIAGNPQHSILNFDFGKILFELYRLNEANIYLSEYLLTSPENVETRIMLGKIAYWQGKRPKESLAYFDAILKDFPDNQDAIEMIEEVLINTSPYLKISSSRYNDSQPLTYLQANVEMGFFHSAWLQPKLEFQNRDFGEGLNFQHFQLANKVALPKTKTSISMRLGVLKNTWTNQSPYTAGLEIRQKLNRNYEISSSIDRAPYLYTLRSLESNVMPTSYSASIGRDTGSKFKSQMTFLHQQFEDDNYVQWFSLWTLFPVVNTSKFALNIGYAFLAAGSKENRFVMENPEEANLSPIFPGKTYRGVFDPYFTPQNQMSHSALAKIDFELSSTVRVSLNNNFGVYASIDNPDLVDGRTAGGGPGNPLFPPANTPPSGINKVFTSTQFFPLDLKNTIGWEISKKTLVSANYNYFKTIWFDSHTFSMSLKMNFWNERKTY